MNFGDIDVDIDVDAATEHLYLNDAIKLKHHIITLEFVEQARNIKCSIDYRL